MVGLLLSLPSEKRCPLAVLPVLEEDAVEHGEHGLLLSLGEAADALELALELGSALAGLRQSEGHAVWSALATEKFTPGGPIDVAPYAIASCLLL